MPLLSLQEVAEANVMNLFEDTNLCAVHAKGGIWLSIFQFEKKNF